jgi:hypothetical protein
VRLLATVEGVYGGIREGQSPSRQALDTLEYGKWVDPLLGVIAWLVRSGRIVPVTGGMKDEGISNIVAGNLREYFESVPDVQIIQAIRNKRLWPAVLHSGREPLFAATLRAAADVARAQNLADHAYVTRSARIGPDAVWNMIVNPLPQILPPA